MRQPPPSLKPPDQDVGRRRPVWAALSELFLDTELQPEDHARISDVLVESAYSIEELEHILRAELNPVLHANMFCVAGEWEGFDLDWLAQTILHRHTGWRRFLPRIGAMSLIRSDWDAIRLLVTKQQSSPDRTA